MTHLIEVHDSGSVCARCGLPGWLHIETDLELLDRCVRCGWERHLPRPPGSVQSGAAPAGDPAGMLVAGAAR